MWDYIRHFKRDEFGYAQGVEPSKDLVFRLEQARDIAGIPFVITSGIRSEERNAMVGGSLTSSHLTGNAVDLHCESSRHRMIMLDALTQAGFNRIGIGRDFIHVDNDGSKPSNVCWLYDA
jgi:zinc D-Ala-D-Ala carboxypeptidase